MRHSKEVWSVVLFVALSRLGAGCVDASADGVAVDAGTTADAGANDAGAYDAGAADAGPADAAVMDAGLPGSDGGTADGGFSCAPFHELDIGGLLINSGRTEVPGFTGDRVVVGYIDAPLSGLNNHTTSLAIYEYIGPTVGRKAWLSEHRCDMTGMAAPGFAQSSAPNLYFSVGGSDPAAFNMVPGRRYYLMITNQRRDSTMSSCSPGWDCEIGITVYLPPP